MRQILKNYGANPQARPGRNAGRSGASNSGLHKTCGHASDLEKTVMEPTGRTESFPGTSAMQINAVGPTIQKVPCATGS